MSELFNSDPNKSGESLEVMAPSVLEALTRAEVDMQISTARKFPRNEPECLAKIERLVTADTETAEDCYYKLPRGGKEIEGASIGFARIAASVWGNVSHGSRVIEIGKTHVVAQGFCRDLQTNVTSTVEERRKIESQHGGMPETTGRAAAAIAKRNAILEIIPKALLKKAYNAARHKAIGDISTLPNRRTVMVKKFAAMGIVEAQVLTYLKRASVSEITLDDIDTMLGVFTAIRDQDAKIEEYFPPIVPKPQFDKNKPEEKKSEPADDINTEPSPIATNAATEEPKLRKRGRPPKSESAPAAEPAAVKETPAAETPAASEPSKVEATPETVTQSQSEPTATATAAEKPSEKKKVFAGGPSKAHDELRSKAFKAGVTEANVIAALTNFAVINDTEGEDLIETIGAIPSKSIQTCLDNWNEIEIEAKQISANA